MARIEPPNLAAWMLEHLIPAAERDEALTGDLEEHFRAGRSDAWYWRQTAVAVATGWRQYIGRRRTMLVFALLWSMLAPAWYVAVSAIEASHSIDNAWGILGPFVLVGWTVLHAAFLWAGLGAYQLAHMFLGKPIPRREMRRAYWLVPLVLPPIYGLAFVIAVLYSGSVPAFEHAKLAATSLGQIADLGAFADVIRIPYFLTMVIAMWRIAPRLRAESLAAGGTWAGSAPMTQTPPTASPSFFAFVVSAGAMNALISGFLLCRLPDAHAPSITSLLVRAGVYVGIGALAGIVGAWIYWNNPASPYRDSAPVDFRLFALACAAGFIWTPAMILFSEQVTPATAFVAAIGAFALAAGLRTVPLQLSPRPPAFATSEYESELFADAFLRPQFEGKGIVVALAIYGGCYAMTQQSYWTASLLLGVAAFMVGWLRTVQRREPARHGYGRVVLRLAIFVLPAVLVTAWALLDGVAYRNRLEAVKAAALAAAGNRDGNEKAAAKSTAHGFGGYDSVILWPYPEKKQIVAPMPLVRGPLAPGTKRPLVIEFDGPYWFLQAPDERPGADAHRARGTPLGVHIAANNAVPITMEARQRLATPIPLARCGQIEVQIENREQSLGVIGMALILEDSSTHKQIYVGRQHIYVGDPDQAAMETFHFKLPEPGQLRRFDGITLMLLPETKEFFKGPHIAVREFRLYPR